MLIVEPEWPHIMEFLCGEAELWSLTSSGNFPRGTYWYGQDERLVSGVRLVAKNR